MELLSYISSLAQEVVGGKKDFVQLEQEVLQMVKALGLLMMEKIIQEADDLLFAGEGRTGKSEGFREKGIQTLFGEMKYRRRLYSGEGEWIHPLDGKLGIQEKLTISPTLEKTAAYMATQNSYRESQKMLEKVGLHLSHQRIHQAVQDLGGALEKEQEQAIQSEPKEGNRKADIVVVESDGDWVTLQGKERKKAKGLEIKVGCLYEGWEQSDPYGKRFRLKHPHVVATTGTAKAYWQRVDHYLISTYNLDEVGTMVFGSDGAPWGKDGAEICAGSLHQIDEFHFQRWIKRTFGFDSRALVDTIKSLIEADDHEGLKVLMDSKKAELPEKKKDIEKLVGTLERNWESVKDYRLRAAKLPGIARGIGNVENTNDNLVSDRMKKRGMAWSIKGAKHLVQVKAAVRNQTWDKVSRWAIASLDDREEQPTEASLLPSRKKGRPQKGTSRKRDMEAWCQAHMPGLEGSEQWLREFSKGIQHYINPAMV